jgi:hypothetical protein
MTEQSQLLSLPSIVLRRLRACENREGALNLKRLSAMAVIAASLGVPAFSLAAPAFADPPPCNQQNCGPPGPHQGGPQGPQGGPRDQANNWRRPGQGAPQAPPPGQNGWNDGPPPGGPPHGWNGPTPPGGWNGPPPAGGWNRHWDGPPRDIDQARFDHQPFNYNGFNAVPIFAPDQGGWGFWFFGIWIPL